MQLKSYKNNIKAFTLLELLVAVSVFSILASIAYGGLTSVMNSDEYNERISQRLSELQSYYLFLQRDVEQTIYRPVRINDTQTLPALISSANENILLEITRGGWQNPLQQKRSELQRVAYFVKDEKLYRAYWSSIDRTEQSIKNESLILSNFKSIQFRFLDNKNTWHATWPPFGKDDVNDQLPVAIEAVVDSNDFGTVKRLFSLNNI